MIATFCFVIAILQKVTDKEAKKAKTALKSREKKISNAESEKVRALRKVQPAYTFCPIWYCALYGVNHHLAFRKKKPSKRNSGKALKVTKSILHYRMYLFNAQDASKTEKYFIIDLSSPDSCDSEVCAQQLIICNILVYLEFWARSAISYLICLLHFLE